LTWQFHHVNALGYKQKSGKLPQEILETRGNSVNNKKILIGVGILAAIALTLIAGGWFISSAFAQGPGQYGWHTSMHNSQALLDLLNTTESDLLKERQAGKSLLAIATAKGVSEEKLIGTLINPIAQMHAWMGQNYPQSNAGQMTEYMRDWVAKDVRESKFGTMTDMRLFGGGMMGGMMGNWNGGNGFGGMMGNWNHGNRPHGMMHGTGMMGAPNSGGSQ
jgi:hypothetical protein